MKLIQMIRRKFDARGISDEDVLAAAIRAAVKSSENAREAARCLRAAADSLDQFADIVQGP